MIGLHDDSLWEKVADLRPRLASHVRMLRHQYRGEIWYVLHDPSNGRFLRFNSAAYALIGHLDGATSLDEARRAAVARLGETAPGTRESIEILAQLHGAEILRGTLPQSVREALGGDSVGPRYRRRVSLTNPLAVRLPLFDPDRLLARLLPWVRPLISIWGLLAWLAVVTLALLLAFAHGAELGRALGQDVLAPRNLVLIAVLFPLVKILHELGHGLLVKAWGGAVHETGITLLVLMPVPYVDATAAWAFRDKYRRAAVGAAGVMVELAVAALAFLAWLALDPGLARDLALNLALIGSVSTLLFNGNPLLKFDAYYVLEDLIEIPNLNSRASRYLLYRLQRHVLRIADASRPQTAPGEVPWLLVYGSVAPVYRIFVMIAIALYLADTYLVVGVALATWSIILQLVLPGFRGLRFLLAGPLPAGQRRRALYAAGGGLAAIALALAVVPAPLVTVTEGVVWLPDRAVVKAAVDGFVDELAVEPGAEVRAGQTLLRLRNPGLETDIAVQRARLKALRHERAAEQLANRARADRLARDIAATRGQLDHLLTRQAALTVTSAVAGRWEVPEAERLDGAYLRQGAQIGYLVEPAARIVRAVIGQDDVGLLGERPPRAEVRLAERPGQVVPVQIARQVPAASTTLPSSALGAAGGGQVSVVTADSSGRTAVEPQFQIDMALPDGVRPVGLGGRVHVRLHHGFDPILFQWIRALRQAFLGRSA